MNRIALIAVLGLGIACTTVIEPAPGTSGGPGTVDGGTDGATSTSDAEVDSGKVPGEPTPDGCLNGQDMDADDVDISLCPPIPKSPAEVKVNGKGVSLGAWELGTTATGKTYVYGSLSAPETNPRVLTYDGGSDEVNDENLKCWAKGYYRLRKYLQTPPKEWLALKDAGFQYRFFQFQTDLRNGATGYKAISSFEDHLVKWVTVIDKAGNCQQPTLPKFVAYATAELKRRNLPVPQ